MTDHASYTYDDSDRKLTIREMGGRVDIFVRDLDDSAMVLLPAEQRQAAAQALAGDGYRVVPADQIDAMSTDGRVRLYPSLPDRPEPVDPASVRLTDFIDIEHEDGNWRGVGTVTGIYPQHGGPDHYIFNVRIGVDDVPLSTKYATVRILRRAAPEPDPAAVEALYEVLRDVYPRAVWDLREAANTLARRGVRVEVPDA